MRKLLGLCVIEGGEWMRRYARNCSCLHGKRSGMHKERCKCNREEHTFTNQFVGSTLDTFEIHILHQRWKSTCRFTCVDDPKACPRQLLVPSSTIHVLAPHRLRLAFQPRFLSIRVLPLTSPLTFFLFHGSLHIIHVRLHHSSRHQSSSLFSRLVGVRKESSC